jgi:selenide,water dikinase
MLAPLAADGDERVIVGPEAADDAGVYRLGDRDLIATADFITPVCDEPERFGAIAAANAMSDVFAMGGRPLFALNLCCFPATGIPAGVLGEILAGARAKLAQAGAALLGGHTVHDPELKFGLAVVGEAPPEALLPLSTARPGDTLILTKPLGTGVLVNAYKFDKLDAAGLEPALREMARLNSDAADLAHDHGAHAMTDVTGFGIAGHALNMARASNVVLELEYDELPAHHRFLDLARRGITTGCTAKNEAYVEDDLRFERALEPEQTQLLFDPQTSGGLLVALPVAAADDYLRALRSGGHAAARVGRALDGAPAVVIS